MNYSENESVIDNILSWANETTLKACRAARRVEGKPNADEYFESLNYKLVSSEQIQLLKSGLWGTTTAINRLFNLVADWEANRKEREGKLCD